MWEIAFAANKSPALEAHIKYLNDFKIHTFVRRFGLYYGIGKDVIMERILRLFFFLSSSSSVEDKLLLLYSF